MKTKTATIPTRRGPITATETGPRRLNLRIPQALYDRVAAAGRRAGITASDAARLALERGIRD